MRSEIVIQRICFINSYGLFLPDFVTLKGTFYLHYFVLNLVLLFLFLLLFFLFIYFYLFIFLIKFVNNLKLVATFTFISFSLRLARNRIEGSSGI